MALSHELGVWRRQDLPRVGESLVLGFPFPAAFRLVQHPAQDIPATTSFWPLQPSCGARLAVSHHTFRVLEAGLMPSCPHRSFAKLHQHPSHTSWIPSPFCCLSLCSDGARCHGQGQDAGRVNSSFLVPQLVRLRDYFPLALLFPPFHGPGGDWQPPQQKCSHYQ